MFNLRYYQSDAAMSVYDKFQSHRSSAVILPTATGKTELYLSIAVNERKRVLVIGHRDYLLTSPIQRLKKVGFEDVGIEKAKYTSERGLDRSKIVFASVQTIGPEQQEHRLKQFRPQEFSLVIFDESHRAVSKSYRRIKDYFETHNPQCKFLFLTATPKRKDGVALGNVCESVAYEMTPGQAAEEGWIVRPRFFRRDVPELDFSQIRLKGSDFDPDQVAAILQDEKPLHVICASLAEFQGPTICFCPKVNVAVAMAAMLNNRYREGKAIAVHMNTPDEEMERATKGLADGSIDWVLNVDKLTEGYDVPRAVRVAWACPTASLVKWTQGCGRVFRVDSSIAGQLTGGREDSAQRRLLIEQSSKPFCEIVTYYPSNMQHQICTAVDLLGGDDLPADVKKYAGQIQDETSRQGGGSDTEQDIETAKAFVNLRAVVDAKRKQIKAKAKIKDTEYNGLGDGSTRQFKNSKDDLVAASANSVTTWGNGEAATVKQLNWLKWKGVSNLPEGLTKFQASTVIDLVNLGVKPETALGYPRRQAMKVRDEMRARQGGKS